MISIAERQKLIKAFPCFSSFTAETCEELANLMQEIHYFSNEVIVGEFEPVDSIFIVVQGEAEVSKIAYRRSGKKKKKPNILAVLRRGEAIGLNDTGFYSETFERTATVKALTDMLLLRLDVKDLYQFLKQHQLSHAMYQASEQMLKIRFIKRSLPFAKLSTKRLKWLSERVEEIIYPAGAQIFKQGDSADRCYLIRAGRVDIIVRDEEGHECCLTTLKPSILFGEAALLTRDTRNATAIAATDCILFSIRDDYLTELIETEQNIANMFMTLMVDRSRPTRNPNVISQQRTTADGQVLTILKNTDNNTYFNLSKEGSYIWRQLNGKHTMQDITLSLAEEYHVFAPEMVAALIAKLTRYGFINNLNYYLQTTTGYQSFWYKTFNWIRKTFSKRFAFSNADPWITDLYQKYLHYIFTQSGYIILAAISIVGFATFLGYTDNVLIFFSDKNENLYLLLLLIPLSLVSIFFHELGHAFAVKACGREVHYIGIGWDFFAPVAFIDTSDMWLATRKQRIFVNISGVYVDAMIAGLCGLSIMVYDNLYVQGMLWVFALYTYIRAFRMLTPSQDTDGYYILMDWTERPRLRRNAVLWLLNRLPKLKRKSIKTRSPFPEISYWLSSAIYLVFECIIVFLLQACALAIFGLEFSNPYSSLILPFVVVILSSLGIIADIRQHIED